MPSPEQAGPSAEMGGLASMSCWMLAVSPAEGQMEITRKNNPFITKVNININHTAGEVCGQKLGKAQNTNKKKGKKKEAKHTFKEK